MGRPRGIQMLLSPKVGGPPPKQLVLEADSLFALFCGDVAIEFIEIAQHSECVQENHCVPHGRKKVSA